ncbi:aldehyde dehydrogenase family protein [Salinibacterium sp. dk2585]|uniref:aldehyde dehydrogenase family protein n=1 Tax=unclassified Salinibacterium TaxID=2632331 RepID=UPI0011C2471A|nr:MULTISPECIES: aldehyde dehydrogenase family protein [unclassified Salinibacterium]QEE61969.1 aldehyde dehydrogenase family protein [Salinibacterium sp. dk2585]TXK54476.1 aldehyde dehydrogenase family protein [Salinibacterium sp. dk5596]
MTDALLNAAALGDPLVIEESLWIDNTAQKAGGDSHSPVDDSGTGRVFALVRDCDGDDVDRAYASAARAQADWARVPVEERVRVVRDAVEILARSPHLAETITREVGTVCRSASAIQVELGLDAMRFTADWAESTVNHTMTIGDSMVIREPAGVAGAITPWNYPIFQVALKVTPAIVAGCSVVLKPPSVAPLTAFSIVSAFAEAGLPAGVLNLVTGPGSRVGALVAGHPTADIVSFTGSNATGRAVAMGAAAAGTRTTMELGGKSAAVVLDAALAEEAAVHALSSTLSNNGQTCAALTRLIVPRSTLIQVEARLASVIGSQIVADPGDQASTVGPLASRAQQQSVLRALAEARTQRGVTVVASVDAPLPEHGWYVPPTVLRAEREDLGVVQEELFGPVLTVQPYDDGDIDGALALANGTEFGLLARVWTDDPGLFSSAARAIRAGGVIQNGRPATWDAPFGGVKNSGHGRERGPFGIEEYLVPKSLQPLA